MRGGRTAAGQRFARGAISAPRERRVPTTERGPPGRFGGEHLVGDGPSADNVSSTVERVDSHRGEPSGDPLGAHPAGAPKRSGGVPGRATRDPSEVAGVGLRTARRHRFAPVLTPLPDDVHGMRSRTVTSSSTGLRPLRCHDARRTLERSSSGLPEGPRTSRRGADRRPARPVVGFGAGVLAVPRSGRFMGAAARAGGRRPCWSRRP